MMKGFSRRRLLGGAALGLLALGSAGRAGAETASDVETRRIVAEYDGIYGESRVAAHVAAVVGRIAAAAGAPGAFAPTVLDSPAYNAIALPDGRIFVARGLVALCNDTAELASILAHEAGHVLGRHAAQRLAQAGLDPDVAAIVGLPADAATLAFTREQEFDADQRAVGLLVAAGWDPGALGDALRAFQTMAASEGLPLETGSHPAVVERLQRVPASGGGARERDAHLAAIDGMAWGEAAGRPILRGTLAIDPMGPVRWQAPAGWRLMRSRLQIVALGPDDATIGHDSITQPGNPSAMVQLTRIWGRRFGVGQGEARTIAGRPAALAPIALRTERGLWDGLLVVIETSAERRDRFVFLCRAGSGRLPQMASALDGFGVPTAAEMALAAPRRIAVVAVEPGESAAALAARMPPDLAGLFRALNGLGPGEEPAAGTRIKLVV
jgi:predicted Zn-dependent protease